MKYWVCDPIDEDMFVVFASSKEEAALLSGCKDPFEEPAFRSVHPSKEEWLLAGYSVFCDGCGHAMLFEGCCHCPDEMGGITLRDEMAFCCESCSQEHRWEKSGVYKKVNE